MHICKFKRGDIVITLANTKGKVIDIKYNKGIPKIRIEYLKSKIKTIFREDELTLHHECLEGLEKRVEVTTDKCPVCGTAWTETRFGFSEWKDCLKCGKRAEDLMDKKSVDKTDEIDYSEYIRYGYKL
jgi:tRNA(Ile2) C34 agmatinyltransferase TiaS